MKGSVVAIGTFDGIHKGHQSLISKLITIAKKKKLSSIVVALSNPVRHVSGILTTPDEKINILKQFPVDNVVVLKVSQNLISQDAKFFVEKFLVEKLKTKHLVVGSNFTFGQARHGNVKWLKKNASALGIKITVQNFVCFHGNAVSSSRIRSIIHQGRIGYANRLLGRNYSFEGIPVKGRGVGKKMGFPTINIKVQKGKLLPNGVFIASVEKNGLHLPGLINIGHRPTFLKKGSIVPEVFLLDFHKKWPKGKLQVNLLKHLRSERKYKTPNQLKKQIVLDIKRAEYFFN
ncbi:riboflavin biosynthesis protein RibF [Elusimicrobiota bacterium]